MKRQVSISLDGDLYLMALNLSYSKHKPLKQLLEEYIIKELKKEYNEFINTHQDFGFKKSRKE